MIRIPHESGRPVAVLGLGKSGLTAARALAASGAEVWAWDDDAAKRTAAGDAPISTPATGRVPRRWC